MGDVLGRKQRIKNDDWIQALAKIEKLVQKKELDRLAEKTVKEIRKKTRGKIAAYAVAQQIKVPISRTKTSNYNLNFYTLSIKVCYRRRHVFLLTIPCHSDIVFMEQKKRKNSPFHSSFFLSHTSVPALYGIMSLS
ncbi:hypothetical protein C823_005174 [Eubacterium plexicaudatum ASF492]|nr:hypothetical protein C823_005174 [Eubacterium plexicaudatum ASF492]